MKPDPKKNSNTAKDNPLNNILNFTDLLSLISFLESKLKEEAGFNFVKICIFDNPKTMECLSNTDGIKKFENKRY